MWLITNTSKLTKRYWCRSKWLVFTPILIYLYLYLYLSPLPPPLTYHLNFNDADPGDTEVPADNIPNKKKHKSAIEAP